MAKTKFNPGFFSGITLIKDDNFIEYVSVSNLNEQGRVSIKSIKAVTLEPGAKNSTIVKFVGEGTDLGYFSTGINYAKKCQNWLMEQLNL